MNAIRVFSLEKKLQFLAMGLINRNHLELKYIGENIHNNVEKHTWYRQPQYLCSNQDSLNFSSEFSVIFFIKFQLNDIILRTFKVNFFLIPTQCLFISVLEARPSHKFGKSPNKCNHIGFRFYLFTYFYSKNGSFIINVQKYIYEV